MDPHQMQNNLGLPGIPNYQAALQNHNLFGQTPAQGQQQYLQFYQNQPTLNDLQQQNLLLGMGMQMHQQQQFYQQQPINLFPQQFLQQPQMTQHNAGVLQQTGHVMQQALPQVDAQQQQQQIRDNEARRLADQQKRLLEKQRKEQEKLLREQERKKQAELAEQQRIREEERKRMEEERERQRLETERKDAELQKVFLESQARNRAVVDANAAMKNKSETIAKPLTFVSCAPLTRLTSLLPFPADSVSPWETIGDALGEESEETIAALAAALEVVDVTTTMVRGEEVAADTDELPPLIASLINSHPHALHPNATHHPTSEPSTSTGIPLVKRDEGMLKMMVSLGKQPKGLYPNNKGKELDSLNDSLTAAFEPSDYRRKRQRVKTYEEEQMEDQAVTMVAEFEAKEAAKDKTFEPAAPVEDSPEGRFYERKKTKKRDKEVERPPTPTDVQRKREEELRERERQRREKRHLRMAASTDGDGWSTEVQAEKEALAACTALIETVLDSINLDPSKLEEDEGVLDAGMLDNLLADVKKLRDYRKIHEIPTERVVLLLTVLEKSIRDVVAKEGEVALTLDFEPEDNELSSEEAFHQIIEERLTKAADAACIAMVLISSSKMPKQVLQEDTMERSVQLCRQYLHHIIYPASDPLFNRSGLGRKLADEPRKRKKGAGGGAYRPPIVTRLYQRTLELMKCFSTLVRNHSLPDGLLHQMNSTALSTFGVVNVEEIQPTAMRLLAEIFYRADEPMRQSVLADLLNILHRVPPKGPSNCYMVQSDGKEVAIANTTALLMHLMQATVKVPKRRKSKHDEDDDDDDRIRNMDLTKEDAEVKDSFSDAIRYTRNYLATIFKKCSLKGEEEHRRLLEGLVHDLLASFMAPEWPVAEMILNALGVQKTADMAVRQAALEYLGLICARLKKETTASHAADNERLAKVVQIIVHDEREDDRLAVDDVDISHMTRSDMVKKAEQSLVDYLNMTFEHREVSIEFPIRFYVNEWYRMAQEDIDDMLKKKKSELAELGDPRDDHVRALVDKGKKKLKKVEEKGKKQKDFLIKLIDRKTMRKRHESLKRRNLWMLDSDALWFIKYLATQRDFCNSFDSLLNQILYGVTAETAVTLRTRAMKSLTQIIEVDPEVLGNSDVRRAVHARMTDPNAAVREATIDLLGKFLLNRPELVKDYEQIMLERIKDSGLAVRKRVIRIIREFVSLQPDYEKVPEMLTRIIRRVNDEEGVKKLVVETFRELWMQPAGSATVAKKMRWMTEMVSLCLKETGALDCMEAVLTVLLPSGGEERAHAAAQQIVDHLINHIIALDSSSNENGVGNDSFEREAAEQLSETQRRQLAALSALSLFSKVCPSMLTRHAETLQPYLSMKVQTEQERNVLNQVIGMLQRIFPYMEHPSSSFVHNIDTSLAGLAKNMGAVPICTSSIACAAALYTKAGKGLKYRPAICSTFIQYMKVLMAWKTKLELQIRMEPKFFPPIQRSIFSMGLMARYFNWDEILNDNDVVGMTLLPLEVDAEANGKMDDGGEGEKEEGPRKIRDNVFTLLNFYCKFHDEGIKHKALCALGHLSAEYPEYLQRSDVTSLYATFLSANNRDNIQNKKQVLRNLEQFLTCEEKRMMKENSEWSKKKEQAALTDMELSCSGLGSRVIQRYWKEVLDAYFNTDEEVRTAAMQVVWSTLSQGLVTPGSSIHVLIAMSTDPLVSIRHKVETLVKEIDAKYTGMVQSKAVQGVRAAFTLQSAIHSSDGIAVRGMRSVEQSATANTVGRAIQISHGAPKWTNDGQALLSGLYQSLRSNRQQRRFVINAMLRLLAEDRKDNLRPDEEIFVADNLAMFPYQVIEEPLFTISSIDAIVAQSGESIIIKLKQLLLPPPSGNADDDNDLEYEVLAGRFPHDTTYLWQLMEESLPCSTLFHLKTFLMKYYAITEAKLAEYTPSEYKAYEKPLNSRKNMHAFLPILDVRKQWKKIRGTPEEPMTLARHFSQFRRQWLALDRGEDEEEDEAPEDTEGEGEGETPVKRRRIEDDEEDEDED